MFKKEDICDECKVIQGEGRKMIENASEIGKQMEQGKTVYHEKSDYEKPKVTSFLTN